MPVARCDTAIKEALQCGALAKEPETKRPLFAFRLHQFLSKGDTVYVSLEPEGTRHVTSQYQVSVPGDREKILLPLAFCRECGQEYLVVKRDTRSGQVSYTPRQDQDASGGDAVNGYLYVSDEHPWPADPLREGRLPDSWYDVDTDGNAHVPRTLDRLPATRDLAGPRRDRTALRAWPAGRLRARAVPVLPALPGLLQPDPRPGLRQAGHLRRRGPQLRAVPGLHQRDPQPARASRTCPTRRRRC